MSKPPKQRVVAALLDRHGRTYCSELGIDIGKNTPAPLFRWLCASILFSTRINAALAMQAARALAEQGWTTAQRMAETSWAERTRTLNRAGYARYDESTSRMLGDTVDLLLREYDGDLRRLREAAGKDVGEERRLLRRCKGMGEVGVDIFFREVQDAWPELYPFADRKALAAAERLDLGKDAHALSRHVDRADYTRLVAALVRTALARDHERVLEQAAQ